MTDCPPTNERERKRFDGTDGTSQRETARASLGPEPPHAGALAHDAERARAYLKVGGRVVYRQADIKAYEATQLRSRTLPPRSGGGVS